MTINIADNSPRANYTATSGQTAFTVSFEFFDEADLTVYINGTETSAYTVTGGDGSTGTVTLNTGATAGDKIAIVRDVAIERTTDFTAGAAISRDALNEQLDKLTAQVADIDDKASRAMQLNDHEVAASVVLPAKDDRKGKILGFNETTGDVEAGPTLADTQSLANVSADIATLADIEDGTENTDAIQTAAANASSISTVASSITNVNTVATNIADVTSVADNMAEVLTADTNAATATTKASEASASATAAAASETAAAASETAAATSETNAATSATSAASSASAASTSATAAQTAQTAAETAETNAETAETNAANSAANSATSAASAATSATNAATSATNAATSATAASTAQTAAEAARDSALASFDSFDDRYLGTKTSDPSVDNDGNALVAGALYFSTTASAMKVYTGSAWVAAYVSGTDYLGLAGGEMTGDIKYGDNVKAKFGASDDLQIYHDGSNSYVRDNGTGTLTLQGSNQVKIQSPVTGENYAIFNDNGAVTLNYDNSLKFATNANGIDVTGTVTADGLTVDGDAIVSSAEAKLYLMDNNNIDGNALLRVNGDNFGIRRVTDDKATETNRFNLDVSTGDISFYEDTGTTAKFFWDASAESLGIGTSSLSFASGAGVSIYNAGAARLKLGDSTSGIGQFDGLELIYDGAAYLYNREATPLIFGTNATERMRIDSSGNLLVGKTVATYTTDGVALQPNGSSNFSRSTGAASNAVVAVNRNTSDGTLVTYSKDGTTVGSIASRAGVVTTLILDPRTSSGTGVGITGANQNTIMPTDAGGNLEDAAIDLGDGFTRFKDLYLSGGVEIENGTGNVGVGKQALNSNTASNNTAVGYQAGYSNVAAGAQVFVGYKAGYATTTGGGSSTFVGYEAGLSNTTGGNNTALGRGAFLDNTTGSNNVSLGYDALANNTTASNNTAVGYQAGYSQTTAIQNTLIGSWAGYSLTTGGSNTFIGGRYGTTGAGDLVTTGSKNTIIGGYNGNQGGLDIRTASNRIVLSDGDGNPRIHVDNNGRFHFGESVGTNLSGFGAENISQIQFSGGSSQYVAINGKGGNAPLYLALTSGSTTSTIVNFADTGVNVGSISTNGSSTSYNTSSDYRLKENVVDLTGATERLKQIPVHQFNFINTPDTTVDGFLAHEVQAIVPEAITGTKDAVDDDGNPVYQGIDQSKLVPLLVATIKELEARITALENA